MTESGNPSEGLISRIRVIDFIVSVLSRLGLDDESQAKILKTTILKFDDGSLEIEGESGEVDFPMLQRAIIELAQQKLICRATSIPEPTNLNDPFTALYPGQFNPPTKGHERFLQGLLESPELAVVAGPDSERTTDSGDTPLKMRRFLMDEFTRRVFRDEVSAGKLSTYPQELSEGTFPERIAKWRAHYGDRLIFCCGSDTYKAILERYPDTLTSVPIIGMSRMQDGEAPSTPFVRQTSLFEMFQDLLDSESDLLTYVFSDHSLRERLEKLLQDTREFDSKEVHKFIARQAGQRIEVFLARLADSERIRAHGKKTHKRLLTALRRLQVYARLIENPLALEKAMSHTTIIGSDVDENSSTRDRLLFAHLPADLTSFEDVLRGEHTPDGTQEVEEQIQALVELHDWRGLKKLLSILETSKPKELLAAIRHIVHEASLAIIYENNLEGLYRDQRETHESPVTREVLEAANEISETLAILGPAEIDSLTAPSQYHLSRSIAGAFFSWSPDDPHLAMQIPRRVLSALARKDSPGRFIPSIVIDRKTGKLVGMLVAKHIPERAMIKYEKIIIDPAHSRNRETTDVFNDLLKARLQSDLSDPTYSDVSVIVAEVPAHETERISQHLLSPLPLAPCGLEPGISSQTGTVEWNVQGMYLRDATEEQGDYYLLPELQPLASAVLDVVAEQQKKRFKYTVISESFNGGKKDHEEHEEPKDKKPIESRLVQSGYEELIFEVEKHGLFSIYPQRSRHLDLSDFADGKNGAPLLEAAIDQAKKLYAQDEWPEPYMKIALPIDTRQSINLQRVLLDNRFVPVRFIPATKNSPAMMTFALMLGDPRMNDVDLPSSRVSGLSPKMQKVFKALADIGRELHEQGTRANTGRSTRLEHIRLGRMRMRSDLFKDVLEKFGLWQVFPSLYAHLHEVLSAFELFRTHISPQYQHLRLPLTAERKFIGLHDSGKAVWAVANRFCREGKEGKAVYEDPASATAQLADRVKRYMDEEFELYLDAWIDWPTFKDILTPRVISAIRYNPKTQKYSPISDVKITVGLIEERIAAEPSLDADKKAECQECIKLYSAMQAGESRLRSTDEDLSALVATTKTDREFFYFSLLELIDNTSRYQLTNPDGSLSLRDVVNTLDLKKAEVLARYGDTEGPITASIRKKFDYLRVFAETLLATP
ncbi:hypothetical protein HY605_02545 [Candidatus Peregrinibacteria bacterium]|nr:hypothetical protein [Candidatus Peregrinibacteria bacterium]